MTFLDPASFLFSASLVGVSILLMIVVSRPGLAEDWPALKWWIAGDVALALHRIILLLQPGIFLASDDRLIGMRAVDFRTADAVFLMVGLACGIVSICRLRNIELRGTSIAAIIAVPSLCVACALQLSPGMAEGVVLAGAGFLPLLQIYAVRGGIRTSMGLKMLTIANSFTVLAVMLALFTLSMQAPANPAMDLVAVSPTLFFPPFFGMFADFVSSIFRTFSISMALNERQRTFVTTLSTTDALTGVLNRRGMQELLRAAVGQATRYQRTFCIAIVDIDHFKRVNDMFGHEAGDTVLKAFAECLQQSKRDDVRIARWGGEEFLLVFPATDIAGALAALERMRIEMPGRMMPCVPCSVTFSAGVAERRLESRQQPLSELLDRADKCLYEAKITRNKVVAAL